MRGMTDRMTLMPPGSSSSPMPHLPTSSFATPIGETDSLATMKFQRLINLSKLEAVEIMIFLLD